MRETAIVSAVRLPVGKMGGALSGFRPEKMGAMVIREAIDRIQLDPETIDEVIFCTCENSDLKVAARVITLEAALPVSVPAYQIQRGCGSSLSAVWDAMMMIRTGYADTVVCGGTESTSLAPFEMERPKKAFQYAPMKWCVPTFSPKEPYGNYSNGQTADNIARQFGISREDCDAFAADSHRKAMIAYEKGYFEGQILPVSLPQRGGGSILFSQDETLRKDTTAEKLSLLPPSFAKDGVCTAGNSSPLTDGASCVIAMERSRAESLGLPILAIMKDFADAGCDPRIMGEGPVHAVRKLMERTGLSLKDVDLIEINEAFASQTLHCCRELDIDMEKLNVNGGAIALGHPFAATGTILVSKLIGEMQRRDVEKGVVSFCIGGGMGVAALFERP